MTVTHTTARMSPDLSCRAVNCIKLLRCWIRLEYVIVKWMGLLPKGAELLQKYQLLQRARNVSQPTKEALAVTTDDTAQAIHRLVAVETNLLRELYNGNKRPSKIMKDAEVRAVTTLFKLLTGEKPGTEEIKEMTYM